MSTSTPSARQIPLIIEAADEAPPVTAERLPITTSSTIALPDTPGKRR